VQSSQIRQLVLNLATILAIGWLALNASNASTASNTIVEVTAQMPHGLSSQGQLLWRFESLLKTRYGNSPIFITLSNKSDKVCGGTGCGTSPTTYPFQYTFSLLGDSRLYLVPAHIVGRNFGNFSVPVLLRGRAISCDKNGRFFLVRYADAISFSLACVKPRPPI
jgi:hypothetical protein